MAHRIRWINSAEDNPVLAAQYGRVLSVERQATVDAALASIAPPLSAMESIPLEAGASLAATALAGLIPTEAFALTSTAPVEADGVPAVLDALYFPGPNAETYLFFGASRLSGLALCQMRAGNVVVHRTPLGAGATVTRIQAVNTADEDVVATFLVGDDPFTAPRLRSDIIVPATGEYDLACAIACEGGESFAMAVNVDRALLVAISGHVS